MEENLSTFVFKNGLPAIYILKPQAYGYTIVLLVGSGPRFETSQNQGISRFYTNVCLQGSQKFPTKEQLNKQVDKLGIFSRAMVNPEYTLLNFSVNEDNLLPALKIFLEMYFNPSLTEEGIREEKELSLKELEYTLYNPAFISLNTLNNMVFNYSSLGFDIMGNKDNIQNFNAGILNEFKNTFFVSQNCLLIIVGPNPKFDFNSLEEAISLIPYGKRVAPPPFDFTKTQIVREKINQLGKISYLSFGALCLGRSSEKNLLQNLLFYLLSYNRDNKRLGVLFSQKLVNSLQPWLKIFNECGLFIIQASCPSTVENQVKEQILNQINSFLTQPIDEEELMIAKNYYLNLLPERLANPVELAQFYGLNYFFSLKEETPSQLIEKVKAVTTDQMEELCQLIFKPEAISWVIVGPGF